MKSNCYRRSALFSMLAVLLVCLALILLAAPSANADSYAASEESSYFGNLVQPYPFNSSNPYVCAQTSLVNAFVYLQNAYPGTYGTSLVSSPSSMDAVARNLNNNYVTTTWSGNFDRAVGYACVGHVALRETPGPAGQYILLRGDDRNEHLG